MTFSDLSSQELHEQLRIYMVSPEGGIRPEIYALNAFHLSSIRDQDGKIHVHFVDGYEIANLFWDLYQPAELAPQFDEDLLESLAYHVLLSSEAWSLHRPLQEDCRKWFEGAYSRLDESLKATIEPPLHADWQERRSRLIQMVPLLPALHDTEHIRFQSLSQSDGNCEQFVLEYLEWLYEQCKVFYEPDGENNSFFELEAFLHIAAARAFLIKRKQGLSEEVFDCLTEVEHTVTLIEADDGLAFPYGEELIAPCHSTQVVTALTYVELSRQRVVNGLGDDALHYLAKAAEYYDFVVMANKELLRDHGYMRFLYDDRFDVDLRLRRKLEARATGLQVSLAEADRVFMTIKETVSDNVPWSRIADDCMALQIAWFITGREDDIKDDRDYIVTWAEYWAAARAWAAEQLSPHPLVKFLREKDETASQDRLKNYFFEDDWSSLSKRAKGRLVRADRDWNTGPDESREPILRHLLRATEQMCFDFIWQPLEENVAHGSNLPEFTNRIAKLAQRRKSPSVHDYSWACRSVFRQTDLARGKLDSIELEFITSRLPSAMTRLNSVAGPADHEPEGYQPVRSYTDDDLRSFFREFIGIGQPGILPQFARIGRKLRRHS